MSLQEMLNNFGVEKDYTDAEKKETKKLKDIMNDRKYNLLLSFLEGNNIYTTGDLKRLNNIEYNVLRSKIPSIQGVGDDKTDLFLNRLDEVRNTRYDNSEEKNENDNVINYGIIGNKDKWHIEVNKLSFQNAEYIDIRKVGPDGSRGKGISINFKDLDKLQNIINSINYLDDDLEDTIQKNSYSSNSLKSLILENEDNLLDKIGDKYDLSIKLFKKKIESLRTDGDIIKFLNNPSILDIKKEQYDDIHSLGLKTAIDIMNEYDKSNVSSTTINNLKIGERINTMTICALANNFNLMLGMYYNEKEDFVILKSQTSGGDYNNKWLDNNNLQYYLQSEEETKYQSLEFSFKPNQVCRDISLNINSHTKVYLFNRDSKNEDYEFCGEVKPIKFINNNKCIVVSK